MNRILNRMEKYVERNANSEAINEGRKERKIDKIGNICNRIPSAEA